MKSRCSRTGLFSPLMRQDLPSRASARGRFRRAAGGFTLIEMIVAVSILAILTGMAVPLVRVKIQREREVELRRDLWEMRDAIDRYKDAADRGAFQVKAGTDGYPPD